MIDSNSSEFKDLLAAWLDALKTMDTKLNAYYMAVASLENNSQFAPAAPYFKAAVVQSQQSPGLAADMDRKYDAALRKWEQLAQQSDFVEALASWLRDYRLERPKQN